MNSSGSCSRSSVLFLVGSTQVKHIVGADTTSEQMRDLRARVWAYVFECYAKRKAAPPSGPDARKEISNDSGKSILR
jgi:hypothetical protein